MSDPDEVHPRDLLSAYLDDELDVEERSKVDRHLAACEDCRTQLAALDRLARAVAGEGVPPVPPDLLERTARRLDAATVVRSRRFGFVLPASIAATIAAVGILVAVQWRQGRLGETVLPVPQAKEEASAPSTTATSALPEPPSSPAPLEDKSFDRLEKDQKQVVEPTQQPPPADYGASQPAERAAKAKLDRVDGGVPGGVIGGVASGAEGKRPSASAAADAGVQVPDGDGNPNVNGARERDYSNAPASPEMLRAAVESALLGSPCQERWSDSGVHGSLAATNVAAAVVELTRIARGAGGAAILHSASDGRVVLAVPRDRFGEVLDALRAHGVSGLPERPPLPAGDDCAGISVALPASNPAP